MSEFKEYHNANHHDGDNTFDDQIYKMTNGEDFDDQFVKDCFDHFQAGQQSQQAKIDELGFKLSSIVNNFDNSCKTIAIHQKFLDDADVANKFLTDKVDELQGRIDGALKSADINFWNSSTVKDMVDILKGNKDEN